MNNLSKEEFWDKLYEKYPEEVQRFYDWVDEYKKREEWTNFFKEGVKYHNLPVYLQGMIILEYNAGFKNIPYSPKSQEILSRDFMAKGISDFFEIDKKQKFTKAGRWEDWRLPL